MKKVWKIIIIIIILIAASTWYLLQQTKSLEAATLELQPSLFVDAFDEEGRVVAAGEHEVYTSYGGKVGRLYFQEGEKVFPGELLAEFDISEFLYQIKILEAQRDSIRAQAELERTQISLERQKELLAAGAISQKEYDDAENKVNSQYYPAQIKSLEEQIELIKHKINESRIYAFLSGEIDQIYIKEGMIVPPGSPLMKILNEGKLRVEVFILTEDAAEIKQGMKVKLIKEERYQDIDFEGKVVKIASTATEKISALGLTEQRIKVVIETDVPENLIIRPGYVLDVKFATLTKENVLIIPKTVLFPYQGADAVWVIENGRAVIRQVVKGSENDRDVIIEQGLSASERIILNPQLEGLKNGTKIKTD